VARYRSRLGGCLAERADGPKRLFTEYPERTNPGPAAPEVASALEDLAQAETAIQKVLGDDSMLHFWDNPFAPAMLKNCRENQEALHKARMLAEDAEEHPDRAHTIGADAGSLNSFLAASGMLNYAVQKCQTGPQLIAMWQRLGPKRPTGELW
jgi:hypothetical protein